MSKTLTDENERLGEGYNNDDPSRWDDGAEDQGGVVAIKRPNIPVGIARKPHVLFDETRQFKFLEEYARTGLKAHSASVAGVAATTVNRFEKDNPQFAELMGEAREFFNDSVQREAHRRAVDGVLEPVFSQKSGEQIGVVRKFSDRLLEVLLKAQRPEQFRDNHVLPAGFKGGVLMVPVAVASEDQWEDQYGDKVKGLPSPED